MRHGETDDNAAARFQGRRDTLLNERGREQSRALAERLRDEGLQALYTSPLQRASATAQILGDLLGLEAIVDARLMEADAGDWSGRLIADVTAEDPQAWERWRSADPAFRFPAGESVAEQAARVSSALADVASGPLPALVVTHGGAIRAVGAVERISGPASGPPARGSIGNCALFRLPAVIAPPPGPRT